MRATSVGVVVFLLAASLARGQAPSAQPRFSAASVTRTAAPPQGPGCGEVPASRDMQGGPGTAMPTTVRFRAASPIALLKVAFGVDDPIRIVGLDRFGFGWNDLYQVVATVPPGTTKAQIGPMLRALLEERFHLAAYRETRIVSVYELTVATGGATLHKGGTIPVPPNAQQCCITADQDGFPTLGPGCAGMAGARSDVPGQMRIGARRVRVAEIIALLEDWLAAPVLNGTELMGTYDFNFAYSAEGLAGPLGAARLSRPTESAATALSAGLQAQLGLHLHPTQASMDLVVVDHMDDKPIGDDVPMERSPGQRR